ncbi:MAG: ABC transporter ATP-binding protein [Ilumatobacteraceae bacterium]
MTTTSTTAGAVEVPAVELRGITKRYGRVVACDDVDLTLHRGRVHGILGENGAGKSTLMKIMIGLVLADSGSIDIDGRPVTIHDPQAAAALGIGMVHQHFSLVDPLTVWENVALGEAGVLRPAVVRERIAEIGEHYGLSIDPDARVGDLTAGLRQRVEIIKCLRRNPSIVIFDEPTSVLTPDESAQLFESFRDVVAAEGRAVVLVSHKLDEVMVATDDVTIMRQGRIVDRLDTRSTDVATLARGMVGREVSLRSERAALGLGDVSGASRDDRGRAPLPDRAPVLELRLVNAQDSRRNPVLTGLSVSVAPGEIVGVAGVEGNGQRALGDLLSSLVQISSGEVLVDGRPVSTRRPGAMAAAGVAVIPEDRHDSGVVLDMTVAENLVMVRPEDVATHGLISPDRLERRASELIERFGIQCSGPDAPLWTLSGGNQQRVVLARELSNSPKVLVAAQPTRGLDVGAIEYMTEQLRMVAAQGVGVLLISSELEEILDLSDRIIVMSRGAIVGEMTRAELDSDRLGLMMGGSAA